MVSELHVAKGPCKVVEEVAVSITVTVFRRAMGVVWVK